MAVHAYNSVTGAPEFSDSDAPDIKVDPQEAARYAGEVGTRPMGSTASRATYAYGRKGLAFMDTDELVEYLHDGTGWKRRLWDTGWKTITVFGSGFTPYSATGWSGVRYRVVNAICYVNGAAINGGSWAQDAPICNIPAEGRPSFKFQGINCQVLTDGNVIAAAAGTGAVSFSASFPIV